MPTRIANGAGGAALADAWIRIAAATIEKTFITQPAFHGGRTSAMVSPIRFSFRRLAAATNGRYQSANADSPPFRCDRRRGHGRRAVDRSRPDEVARPSLQSRHRLRRPPARWLPNLDPPPPPT